jgi:hypothetical protein
MQISRMDLIEKKLFDMVKHITPIFKFDDEEIPFLNGTGILIQLNNKNFIITASHVLDKVPYLKNDHEDMVFAFSNGKLTEMAPSNIFKTKPKNGSKDIYDFAIMDVPEKTNFDFSEYYKIEMVDSKQVANEYGCVTGFTEVDFKKISIRNSDILRNSQTYFGTVSKALTDTKIDIDPDLNSVLSFDIKRSYKNGQHQVKAVTPNGISGGPCWVLENAITAGGSELARTSPILHGIVTEYINDKKVFITTDLKVILSEIVVNYF